MKHVKEILVRMYVYGRQGKILILSNSQYIKKNLQLCSSDS